jgi:hypothetical protein
LNPIPNPKRELAVPVPFVALDIMLAVLLLVEPAIEGGWVKDDGRGERERE